MRRACSCVLLLVAAASCASDDDGVGGPLDDPFPDRAFSAAWHVDGLGVDVVYGDGGAIVVGTVLRELPCTEPPEYCDTLVYTRDIVQTPVGAGGAIGATVARHAGDGASVVDAVAAPGGGVVVAGVWAERTELALLTAPDELAGGAFVASLDGAGEVRWATAATGRIWLHAIAGTAAGGFVIAGAFVESANLAGTVLTTDHPQGAMVLAALDARGAVEWVRTDDTLEAATAILPLDGGSFVVQARSRPGACPGVPCPDTVRRMTAAGRSMWSVDGYGLSALYVDAAGDLVIAQSGPSLDVLPLPQLATHDLETGFVIASRPYDLRGHEAIEFHAGARTATGAVLTGFAIDEYDVPQGTTLRAFVDVLDRDGGSDWRAVLGAVDPGFALTLRADGDAFAVGLRTVDQPLVVDGEVIDVRQQAVAIGLEPDPSAAFP